MKAYDVWKTVGKFLKTFGIAVAVMLVGALIEGLKIYVPDGEIMKTVWALCGAAVMGGLAALQNWLKHKQS